MCIDYHTCISIYALIIMTFYDISVFILVCLGLGCTTIHQIIIGAPFAQDTVGFFGQRSGRNKSLCNDSNFILGNRITVNTFKVRVLESIVATLVDGICVFF